MKDYTPAMSFGADVAPWYGETKRGDEEAAVEFLVVMAGAGPALELAIGAGRIALPLAARGIRVDGIDIAPAMVDEMRKQPGGDAIDVVIGDFVDVAVPGMYSLIYVVWNSFFNVLSQDDQVRCFENVASRLADGGSFVIEAGSPELLYGLRGNQYVETEAVEVDRVRIDVLRIDTAMQTLEESHVTLSAAGIHLNPVMQRYSWPAELDLMARIAGLRLKERWGGWSGEPFASGCRTVVSVYGR